MASSMQNFFRSPHFLGLTVFLAIAGMAGSSPAHADITIGLAGPLTGSNAAVGTEMRLGMEGAVQEINNQGGVLHQKLVLSSEDDACDDALAVAAAKRLVERNVRFVVGHYCSGATLLASPIYADVGTLEITLSSNAVITEQGFDGLYRIAGRSDQQGRILADYLATHFAGERVAILADRSVYGVGLAAAVRPQVAEQGKVTLAVDLSIDVGTKDFSTIIDRLKETGVQAVVLATYPTEGGLIAKQAAAAGLKLQFVAGSTFSNHLFWEVAGPSGEGTIFVFVADGTKMPSAHDAVEKLRAHNVDGQGYTLYAYAAVQLFADAIERAQSIEPDAVNGELQKGGLSTVLGDIAFDENGDNLTPNWHLFRWTESHYVDAN
jgi:branched-chain amino acid transport system substrate-binding protein